ncbi:hypothetical protein RB593_008174 [Gaeumannomyces tritici]
MASPSDVAAAAAQALGPDHLSSHKAAKGSWVAVSLQRLVQHRLGNFPRQANTFGWVRNNNSGGNNSSRNSSANARAAEESLPNTVLPGPPYEPAPDAAAPGPLHGQPELPREEAPIAPQVPEQYHDHDHGHQNHHNYHRQASREDVPAPKEALDRLDNPGDTADSAAHSQQAAKGRKHQLVVSDSDICLEEHDVDGITLGDNSETKEFKIHPTVSKNSSQGSTSSGSKYGRHRIPHISLKSLVNTSWLRQRRRKDTHHSPFPVLTAENVQVTHHITVEYHHQAPPHSHPITPDGPDCRITAEYPDYVTHQALFGGSFPHTTAEEEEEEEQEEVEAEDAPPGPIAAGFPGPPRRGRPRKTSLTLLSSSDHEQEEPERAHTPLTPRPHHKRQQQADAAASIFSSQQQPSPDYDEAAADPVQFLRQSEKLQEERRRSYQDSKFGSLRRAKPNSVRSRTESGGEMRNPPPEVTAAWPKPNYVDPEHRGNELLVAATAVLGVALFCLALRLYVRIAIVRKSRLDDRHMVVAAFFGAGVTVCTILMTKLYLWERHVWDLTPDQITNGRKVSMAGQSLFSLATCFAKLSILLSYIRIAPEHSLFRRFTWGSMALAVAIAVAPISTYWDLGEQAPVCLRESLLMFSLAVANVTTDLLLAVLPMPTLAKLNLPLGQRIATIALFSLGLVVIAVGVVRCYWIYDVVVLDMADFTWEGANHSYNVWIWTALECNLAINCGSIPVLRPLFFVIISGGTSGKNGTSGVDRDLGIRLRRQQSTGGPTGSTFATTAWAARREPPHRGGAPGGGAAEDRY